MSTYSFTIHSRYGHPRTVTLVDPKRGLFHVTGPCDFVRGGEGMFDFEGGPMYAVGIDFHGMGKITAITTTYPNRTDTGEATVLVSVKLSAKAKKEIRGWQEKNYG